MLKEIHARRSIRKYRGDAVPEEVVTKILEAARLAPSGNNTQPWRFIVVRSEQGRKALTAAANNQQWMLTAPVFIVCVADAACRLPEGTAVDEFSTQKEVKLVIRDTAVATGHILLEAAHQNLGTCWVGMYTQETLRPVLGLPDDKYVLGIITLGYPDEALPARPRKSLDELVHYEKW